MNDLKIREAAVADLPQMCSLFQNDLGYAECTLEIVEKQFAGLDANREAVFVAEVQGKVAGVIHIERYDVLYFPPMSNILGLAVSSDFRRMGIGSALLKRAEQWALDHKINTVRLNSGGTRTQAHQFYRAQGYVDDKTQLRFIKALTSDAEKNKAASKLMSELKKGELSGEQNGWLSEEDVEKHLKEKINAKQ